jgi:hypothetical protein
MNLRGTLLTNFGSQKARFGGVMRSNSGFFVLIPSS